MADRNLFHLQPPVYIAAKNALEECEANGLDTLVTCTMRTRAEQAQLYAQGRTASGNVVTNAKPGESYHEYGVALDLYPVVHGKINFDGLAPEWHKIADIFKKHGFEWGYEWKHFKEMPHFQMTGGHPLSYFQEGGKL